MSTTAYTSEPASELGRLIADLPGSGLLARVPAGRYLITSRRASGWHATAVPVQLDVLDPAEAQDLLAAILAPARPQHADGAAELCAELGFLPLAIEQAGAYLAQGGGTPREYLDLLARYPAAMYQAAPEGGDAARTIARIWHVTLDRLTNDPLAGQVLRILAWYVPDAIPRTLLDGLAHLTPTPRTPPTSSARPGCSSTARASPAARPDTSSVHWPATCGCWAPSIP
jgi:hypothetical protein